MYLRAQRVILLLLLLLFPVFGLALLGGALRGVPLAGKDIARRCGRRWLVHHRWWRRWWWAAMLDVDGVRLGFCWAAACYIYSENGFLVPSVFAPPVLWYSIYELFLCVKIFMMYCNFHRFTWFYQTDRWLDLCETEKLEIRTQNFECRKWQAAD